MRDSSFHLDEFGFEGKVVLQGGHLLDGAPDQDELRVGLRCEVQGQRLRVMYTVHFVWACSATPIVYITIVCSLMAFFLGLLSTTQLKKSLKTELTSV